MQTLDDHSIITAFMLSGRHSSAGIRGSGRGSFVGYIVSGGTRWFEGANLEAESELRTRVLRCKFRGFTEAARHDKPIAAHNLLRLAKRPVTTNARFGN